MRSWKNIFGKEPKPVTAEVEAPPQTPTMISTEGESGGELASAADRVSPLPLEPPGWKAGYPVDSEPVLDAEGAEYSTDPELGVPVGEGASEPGSLTWWARSWSWLRSKTRLTPSEREAVKVSVSEKTAMACVKGPFEFLAAYDHPAWALTDDEARGAAPEMAEALEKILDRYVPESLVYLKAKNPEAFAVVVVMGKLVLVKRKQVKEIKIAEAQQAQVHPEVERYDGV